MNSAYTDIVKDIHIAYQPIIDLKNGHVTGEEAFCRSATQQSPTKILSIVEELKKTTDFDIDIHTLALSGHVNTAAKKRVFLNTEQITLASGRNHLKALNALITELALRPKDVVIEVCEREYDVDDAKLTDALLDYKRAGYRLALDDVDTHQMNLSCLLKCDWDYVKISDKLIHGLDKEPDKRAMIKSLSMYARYKHAKLIAEGVETQAELEALIKLNVDYAQGYFIGKPGTAHSVIDEALVARIDKVNRGRYFTQSEMSIQTHVGHIMRNYKSLSSNMRCKEVHDFFQKHDYDSVCFLDEKQKIAGAISKQSLHLALSTKYGYSLYSDRPIEELYDPIPLVVNYFTPVKDALGAAMNRTESHTYDDIIIADNGIYHGVILMRDVIGVVSTMESQAATQLNPLTALPGNNIINNNIDHYLRSNESVLFIYIDLSDFKTYNDFYGFEKGDAVIKQTAEILRSRLENLPYPSFIGHIGGDDFVCMLEMDSEDISSHQIAKSVLQDIIDDFETNKPHFYTKSDYTAGHIADAARTGKYEANALTNINIASYFGRLDQFDNLDSFAEHMATIKRKTKDKPFSNYLILAHHQDQVLELA